MPANTTEKQPDAETDAGRHNRHWPQGRKGAEMHKTETKPEAAKPTPGPWETVRTAIDGQETSWVIRAPKSPGYVARVRNSHEPEEVAANARLIAAAPELAKTLDQISRHAHAATADGMTAADRAAILHTISRGAAAALTKAGL